MRKEKDLRIVRRAINGDRRAFDKLIASRSKNVLYIALNLLSNKETAEDAAQEAIIRISKGIGTLKDAALFDTWMYRIVYNTCMNMVRDNKHIPVDIEDYETSFEEVRTDFLPEEFITDIEKRSELIAAIKALPERHRMCILMYYYEDMSYADIAEVMQLKVKDVSNTLARAKGKLRCSLLGAEEILADASAAITDKVDRKNLSEVAAKGGVGGSLAGVPILARAFEADADERVSQDMVDHLIDACTQGAASSLPNSGALPALAATLHGKILIVGLAVLSLAGAGFVLGNAQNNNRFDPFEVPTEQAQPTAPQEINVPQKSQEPINSVLPEEQAQKVEMLMYQDEAADQEGWQEVIEEAALVYRGEAVDHDHRYRIYTKDDQRSGYCLMIIERNDDKGSFSLASNVVVSGTTLPEYNAIVEAFELWRSS